MIQMHAYVRAPAGVATVVVYVRIFPSTRTASKENMKEYMNTGERNGKHLRTYVRTYV